MGNKQKLQYAIAESWYLAKRYGELWRVFARKVNWKKDLNKPIHLIINELRNKGEFDAIEALHIIEEDMKLPYDYDRIQTVVDNFLKQHANID